MTRFKKFVKDVDFVEVGIWASIILSWVLAFAFCGVLYAIGMAIINVLEKIVTSL